MSEEKKNNIQDNYKFKALNIYASTEWLANNAKKYRQVFNVIDTSYIYAELSFYNKLFDQENWIINIQLKCFEVGKKKQICSLDFKKKISKHDNIAYIREGWGNKKEGSFWKKGVYYWEAWIEDEKVATKYFYVEAYDFDWDTFSTNNLELLSMKLYEGSFDDVPEISRKYLKTFSNDETRYIYSELVFNNKTIKGNYNIEVFLKFYNQARELKGEVSKIVKIKQKDQQIRVTAGWGSNIKGSWRIGQYTAELVLLDKLVAQLPFEVAFDNEEGVEGLKIFKGDKTIAFDESQSTSLNYQETLEKFNNLIGLQSIKKQIKDHSNYIKYLQLRREKGLKEEEDINIHSVFTGNPGTGKTTVAKMMGAFYKNMGLLSKGHVHEVDRSDIVGEYIGQTAPKVKKAIAKARGGVLFIDEAYSLARTNDDSKDFGREAIEILVKEMSSKAGDLAIIVAGYPKEMDHFINSNPGLKSRFKHYFEFPDYLPQELIQIADHAAKEQGVYYSKAAKERLNDLIIEAYRNRGVNFGNARFVHDLVEKSKVNLGLRVMQTDEPEALSARHLNQILVDDVLKVNLLKKKSKPFIPVDKELLSSSLAELNKMIGMDNIKQEIHELVDIVNFHKNNGKDVLNNFFLHTLFIGNPGTGKTSVARILTKIYKALGLLERGHIIETDRQGLVAGYLGQTAIKTNERINEAAGGVLFIDEAYALSNFNGLQGDYGNEAIQTILKRMEDDRGEFFVFAAGYPGNMEIFLKANPGLRSRFDKVLKFEDYSAEQLLTIAESMLTDNGYKLENAAKDILFDILIDMHSTRTKFFGNAREVRKIVYDLIKNQNLRLAHKKITASDQVNKIRQEDLKHLTAHRESDLFVKESIGFKK
ncbi:MAG: AAA family ATPase [Saprospiraceae bacterium]|nr:AAA family ATPase [Bacteroidia bacterium]NNL93974.1 AAA family ATPase [Saprospiraceae bacterium]